MEKPRIRFIDWEYVNEQNWKSKNRWKSEQEKQLKLWIQKFREMI